MSITPETLVTAAGVQAYLENTAFASHTVDLLSGGFTNFTYRIHPHTPIDGRSTFVLKYAPPYVASSILGGPTRRPLSFSVNRSSKRGHSDCLASSTQSDEVTVDVPALRFYDEEMHIMIINNAGIGSRTLKEVPINETPPTALLEEVRIALGLFLGHLHESHERRDVDLSLSAKNEDISARMAYSRIVSTLTGKHEYPALSNPLLDIPSEKLATFSKLEETRSREIRSSTAADAMTHGDFWSGNVVVCLRRDMDDKVDALKKMCVLNWEVAKTGLPGLDLGQLCAELYLISRFHPQRKESATTVMRSLLSAYRRSIRKVDPGLAGVVVGHGGAHLVTWAARISWGGREQTRKVVQEGVEMLSVGCEGSLSPLQDSIVGPLLSE